MEKLLKDLGINEKAGAEEIVGKRQTGIAREEDEGAEDFSDIKGQSAETAPAKGQDGKTEAELYYEVCDLIEASDYARGVEMMQRLAESGYADAQNRLGVMYADGEGVARDPLKAVEWYGKAAEQGDAWAQFNLGDKYRLGEGVAQDYLKAAMWYQRAAEQGYAEAQCNLGNMYYAGCKNPLRMSKKTKSEKR
ncbi:MAG: sel1 repeat family protein [Firmicutes bacterium]|nr:sel1 repeat family protein [Bacillota bacterium]